MLKSQKTHETICRHVAYNPLIESGSRIERRWYLRGPGPARFGWWAITPAGKAIWLGRTVAEILAR
jgi:hypothetical protein